MNNNYYTTFDKPNFYITYDKPRNYVICKKQNDKNNIITTGLIRNDGASHFGPIKHPTNPKFKMYCFYEIYIGFEEDLIKNLIEDYARLMGLFYKRFRKKRNGILKEYIRNKLLNKYNLPWCVTNLIFKYWRIESKALSIPWIDDHLKGGISIYFPCEVQSGVVASCYDPQVYII